MPRVGFEPMTPVFERSEAVHALDRAATVIGTDETTKCNTKCFLSLSTNDRTVLYHVPRIGGDLTVLLYSKPYLHHPTDWTRGLIRYIASSFSTVLRSKLQYASVVWNSITLMDSCKLQRIQSKFAALCYGRFVSGICHNKPTYEVILVTMNHFIPSGGILIKLAHDVALLLIFARCLVRISAKTPTILTETFQWYLSVSVLRNRPRPLPSISFSIHPPLIILWLDTIEPDTENPLNKP
jgi:hypothetical protein